PPSPRQKLRRTMVMKKTAPAVTVFACACLLLIAAQANAQILLANGQLIESRDGSFADLSGLRYTLENGAQAHLLGGLGSSLAYAGGNTFLAVPDRGPNAVNFNALIDNTTSFIARFHTIKMTLDRNHGPGLPFTLKPHLRATTLLFSSGPLN